MIKAVVFDYGGTLVNSARPWSLVRPRALRHAYSYLKRRGLKLSFSEYLSVNEGVFSRYAELEAAEQRDISDRLKYFDIVGELFPGSPKTKRLALALGANDSFWSVANKNFTLRHGTKMCLDELESMGVSLGLISNHHDSPSLLKSLRACGIERRFNPIVVSEQVNVRKPNPAIFKMCLAAMNVKPKQAIYVGDVPEFDVAGAKATGMTSILMANKDADGFAPDFSVDGMREIPPIVANLNADGHPKS
jgi:HAD superfamily hydrolase (TIGR01509 family)